MRFVHLLLALFAILAIAPAHAQDAEPPAEAPDPAGKGGGIGGGIQALTDPLVRMRVSPVGDGLVRDSEWASLHVQLANLGDPLVGELVIRTRTSDGEDLPYRRRIELPAGSRKDVSVLWKPGVGGGTRRIVFEAGRRTIDAEFPVRFVGNSDVAIGVIGEDAAGVNKIRDTWSGRVPARAPMPVGNQFGQTEPRNVYVGLIPEPVVPDRASGLDPFNWLVWVDADPSKLSTEQAAALRAWVAGGGHLLMTVTERWRQVGEGQLADLLPVRLSGTRDGTAAAQVLRAAGGPPASVAIAPEAIAELRDGPDRIVQSVDDPADGAAWSVGTYGLGTVHVVTADVRLDPLASGMPRELLWRQLLWLPPQGSDPAWFGAQDDYGETLPATSSLLARPDGLRIAPELLAAMDMTDPASYVGYSGIQGMVYGADPENWSMHLFDYLQDIPGVAPLPMSWLLTFAAIYLLIIGPVDYFVLKAIGRQPLTWITFPVYIALFSGVALVGTSYVKGSQAIVTRYELVDVLPGAGGLWRGASWHGVWATRRTSMSLASGFGDGVTETLAGRGYRNNVQVRHGTGSSALSWSAETWTLSHARTIWTAPGQGVLRATYLDKRTLEIRNETPFSLSPAVADVGGLRYDLGALPAGGTVQIDLNRSVQISNITDYPNDAINVDDAYDWGVAVATNVHEVRRGHVSWTEFPVIVLGVADSDVESSKLEGLTPVPRTLTVIRAPLRPEAP